METNIDVNIEATIEYFESLVKRLNFSNRHVGKRWIRHDGSMSYALSTSDNCKWVWVEYNSVKTHERRVIEHLTSPKSASMTFEDEDGYCSGFMLDFKSHADNANSLEGKQVKREVEEILGKPMFGEDSTEDDGFHYFYTCNKIHKDSLKDLGTFLRQDYGIDGIKIWTFNVCLPLSYNYKSIKMRYRVRPITYDFLIRIFGGEKNPPLAVA